MTKRGGQHGSITVFLCIVLASIIAVMGVLIDGARLRTSEAQLRRAAQLAVDSVMAEYSQALREDYGLMALSPNADVNTKFAKYLNANLTPNAVAKSDSLDWLLKMIGVTGDATQYGDPLKLSTEVDVGGAIEHELGGMKLPDAIKSKLKFDTAGAVGLQPITEPDVMYQQIMEFSKYRVPMHMLTSGLFDVMEGMEDLPEQLAADVDATKEMLVAGEEMQVVFDAEILAKQKMDEVLAAQTAQQSAAGDWNDLVRGMFTCPIDIGPDHKLYNVDLSEMNAFCEGLRTSAGSIVFQDAWTAADSIMLTAYHVTAYREDLDALKSGPDAASSNMDNALEAYGADMNNGYFQYDEDKYDIVANQFSDAKFLNEDAYEVVKQQAAEQYLVVLSDMTYINGSELNAANEALKQRMAEMSLALDELQRACEQAGAEIERVNEGKPINSCSEEVKESWSGYPANGSDPGDAGDYVLYTDALAKISENIAATRRQLAPDELVDAPATEAYDAYEAALQGTGTYDLNRYTVPSYEKAQPYETSFRPDAGEEEGHYNKVKDLTNGKEPPSDNDEERYRKDPLPRPGEAVADGGSEVEKNGNTAIDNVKKKSKNKTLQKATGDATDGLLGPVNGLIEPISDWKGTALGSVYASDYLLTMFGNAAPEQEDQAYDPNEFKYQRITNLRGALAPIELNGDDPRLDKNKIQVGRNGFFKNAEVEYLLYGKDMEKANVTRAQLPLMGISYVCNVFQVQRHRGIKGVVSTASSALMALTGVPSIVFRIAFYMALAGVETAFDMYYLMRGYKVPIFSFNGDLLFMMNMADPSFPGELFQGKRAKGALDRLLISYELYLRLQLIGKLNFDGPRRIILQNMANLMACNIAEYTGNPFDPAKAYCTVAGIGAARMPYWFMTAPMMRMARQEQGYRILEPAVVVQSY